MRILRTLGVFASASAMFLACATSDPVDEVTPPEEPTPVPEREDVPEVTEIPDTCNGRVELCERHFNDVSFPATHNAMSNADDGWKIPNQKHVLSRQLDDGIRAMLLDVHLYKGELMLCHSLCQLGKRPLDDALHDLRDFLRTNRGDVLTLIIQDETTEASIVAALQAKGLDDWAYVHDGGEWPTLREMIDSNKRLVVTAERSGGNDVAWFHNAWDVMFDNPYTYKDVEDFSCMLNRGLPMSPLFLMNHWLQKPNSTPELAAIANTFDVLFDHATACTSARGTTPNFVAVDHYNVGDLFEVVDALNGFTQ